MVKYGITFLERRVLRRSVQTNWMFYMSGDSNRTSWTPNINEAHLFETVADAQECVDKMYGSYKKRTSIVEIEETENE